MTSAKPIGPCDVCGSMVAAGCQHGLTGPRLPLGPLSHADWIRAVTTEASQRGLVVAIFSRHHVHAGNGLATKIDVNGIEEPNGALTVVVRLNLDQRLELPDPGDTGPP